MTFARDAALHRHVCVDFHARIHAILLSDRLEYVCVSICVRVAMLLLTPSTYEHWHVIRRIRWVRETLHAIMCTLLSGRVYAPVYWSVCLQ